MQLTECQSIETFHLLFLEHLGNKVDKRLFILKGGCNLRFFFNSLRYSEDIDFDLHTMSRDTFEKNVSQLLASPAFQRTLATRGIEMRQATAAKQTDTVQRWKIQLALKGIDAAIPTKIEFSRRVTHDTGVLEKINPGIASGYQLPAFLAQHYPRATAIRQKIEALANRNETQARDVFDLDLLIAVEHSAAAITTEVRAKSLLSLQSISYDDYAGQVVAYLEESVKADFQTHETWERMCKNVAKFIGEVARVAD